MIVCQHDDNPKQFTVIFEDEERDVYEFLMDEDDTEQALYDTIMDGARDKIW
jgi:hypothetical protein